MISMTVVDHWTTTRYDHLANDPWIKNEFYRRKYLKLATPIKHQVETVNHVRDATGSSALWRRCEQGTENAL